MNTLRDNQRESRGLGGGGEVPHGLETQAEAAADRQTVSNGPSVTVKERRA